MNTILKNIYEDILFNNDDSTPKGADFFINPTFDEFKLINAQGGNTRGIITKNGNVVLVTPQQSLLHKNIINYLVSQGVLKTSNTSTWNTSIENFIGIKQKGNTTAFVLADSYAKDVISKYGKTIQTFYDNIKNEGMNKKFQFKMEVSTDAS